MIRLCIIAASTFVIVPLNVAAGELPGDKTEAKPGSFGNRTGANRETAVREGGGTKESEAAVERGIKWLVRQQLPEGKWMLNAPGLDGSESNDVAATAFGLLPMLGAGHTHKPARGNPYDKVIDKGLKFLIRNQNGKTGYLGVSMYAHPLGTMALCEAYGMTQDPALKKPAQLAVDLIVNVQHDAGGWRYAPVKAAGDTSVTGWQIMAIKSAQIAGLNVPQATLKKAIAFLDSTSGPNGGNGYTGGETYRMTAVGLLCRQHLQNWGPNHPRYIKASDKFLKENPPDKQDVYYTYYATQVMHNAGGKDWQEWNEKMRDYLIKKQDADEGKAVYGSWSPQKDPFGKVGGRLMVTSMNLMTLEVYYRYAPLFAREKAKD